MAEGMEMGELGAGSADIDADADDDAVKDGSEGEDEETTFYDLPDVPIEGLGGAERRISGYAGDAARNALVDEFYEYTERTQGIRRPTDIDYDRFVVGSDGRTLELQVGVNRTVQNNHRCRHFEISKIRHNCQENRQGGR